MLKKRHLKELIYIKMKWNSHYTVVLHQNVYAKANSVVRVIIASCVVFVVVLPEYIWGLIGVEGVGVFAVQ